MMRMALFAVRSVAMVVLAGSSVFGQTVYDADATPAVIMGDGVGNGGFTVTQANGVELALRGKLRFNDFLQPENTYNSNGDGTYSFRARDVGGISGIPQLANFPEWSFEFSVNSDTVNDTRVLGALTYEMGIDQDPSLATDFLSADPITGPNPAAGGAVVYDHFCGTNSTGPGGGVSDPFSYAAFLQTKTVAQNGWNYGFFLAGLPTFDADEPGVYDIYLKAFENGIEIASVSIQILVGAETFGDAQQLVTDEIGLLTDYTYSVNVSKGIDNSLDKKLENVLEAYIAGLYDSPVDILERLSAYISHVESQRGKKLPDTDADDLRAGAEYIQWLVYLVH